MYTEKLTYTNFNDEEVTETFHFNFTKSELMTMEYSEYGGMINTLEEIVGTKDKQRLIKIFQRVLRDSYGKKTPDGRFEKSKELSDAFAQTAAYDILFMRFATDDVAAAEFIKKVFPKDLGEAADQKKLVANA